MSKEYKFNGKAYIAKKESCGCKDCAFDREDADICRKFLSTKGVPHCSLRSIIFVEKTEDAITKSPNDKNIESVKVFATRPSNENIALWRGESSWGVKPGNKMEIRSDRVIADSKNVKNTWSFQINMDNGYRPAQINVIASKTADNCKFTAAILPDANRFIVCLTENSKLAPADIPKIHPTRESAEKEAERLCKLHHQEFVVLQVVSAVKPQEPKKEVFA